MKLLERSERVFNGDLAEEGGGSEGSSARLCVVDEKRRVEDGGKRFARHREQREIGVNTRVICAFIVSVDMERKEIAALLVVIRSRVEKSLPASSASSARRSCHQELLRLRSPHFCI